MNDYSDELQIERWAKPFYFSFLHAPPLRPSSMNKGETQEEWLQLLRARVEDVSPEVVSFLLRDLNWRTRICGAWFCGLKRWDDFLPLIAQLLLKNQLIWQAQGFAFGLARFNCVASSLALRSYLECAIKSKNPFPSEDVKSVLGALFYLDENLGRDDASDFAELWRAHLSRERRAHNIQWARELPQFWHESPANSIMGRKSEGEIEREIEQLCEGPLPDFVLNCVEDARKDFQQLMQYVEELGF